MAATHLVKRRPSDYGLSAVAQLVLKIFERCFDFDEPATELAGFLHFEDIQTIYWTVFVRSGNRWYLLHYGNGLTVHEETFHQNLGLAL